MDYTLEIQSWAGLSIGATHYYGAIRDEEYERVGTKIMNWMARKLTSTEAGSINAKLEWNYSPEYYQYSKVNAGDLDYRFDTKEEVLECAKKEFLSFAESSDRLLDYKTKEILCVK